MRVELIKLLEKLGVSRILSPYETQPWLVYDEIKGLTCSAEVRMGPGNEDLEAEIQFLFDEKEDGDDDGDQQSGGYQQIMLMRAKPTTSTEWTPKQLFVKNEDYENKFHNWEEKGCDFFRACIASIQMSEIPNIEELVEQELSDDDKMGGGRSGRIGRKSPKVKPGALLGMKK